MRLKAIGKTLVSFVLILTMLMSSALAYEELAKGSKGNAVIELQERLNELGYSVGTADGDYGGKTVRAVAEFQLNNALSMTGVYWIYNNSNEAFRQKTPNERRNIMKIVLDTEKKTIIISEKLQYGSAIL